MALRVSVAVWRGLPAWEVLGGDLKLVITQIGGHIASVSEPGSDLNPLWQPNWKAANPTKIPFDGAKSWKPGWIMAERYGGGHDSSALAGIVGHNLCIDRFGPAWDGEKKPFHGEAGVSEWSMDQSGGELTLANHLPLANLDLTRVLRIEGKEAIVTTTVKPRAQTGTDTPIDWCEHVTVGDPFLDGARITAGVGRVWNWAGDLTDWVGTRFAEPGVEVDRELAISMPAASEPPVSEFTVGEVEEPRFEVQNMGKTLVYQWDKEVHPWLGMWTESKARTGKPWNGQTRARGMEFSSKAYPEGMVAERRTEFMGKPNQCLVPDGGKTSEFSLSWL